MNKHATTGSVIGYGYSRTLDLSYSQAVESAREALKAEGFGVFYELPGKRSVSNQCSTTFNSERRGIHEIKKLSNRHQRDVHVDGGAIQSSTVGSAP